MREIRQTIRLPQGLGKRAIVEAMEALIKIPRVQYPVTLDRQGVHFTRVVDDGEQDAPAEISLDTVSPWEMIRVAGEIVELETPTPQDNAAVCLAWLFDAIQQSRLQPIAFVMGRPTLFWSWFKDTTKVSFVNHEELYGLPVYTDPQITTYSLFLSAGHGSSTNLANTHMTFKLTIPRGEEDP